MKKTWLVVGILAVTAIAGGLIWFVLNKTTSSVSSTDTATSQDTSQSSPSITPLPGESTKGTTPLTEVAVTIKDFSFQPATIKIKKGTKVTWTNQDSTMHNVVADSSSNVAGLPTTNDLLTQGKSYSFTFKTVGTVTYHCAPHASTMKGTVEVTE